MVTENYFTSLYQGVRHDFWEGGKIYRNRAASLPSPYFEAEEMVRFTANILMPITGGIVGAMGGTMFIGYPLVFAYDVISQEPAVGPIDYTLAGLGIATGLTWGILQGVSILPQTIAGRNARLRKAK